MKEYIFYFIMAIYLTGCGVDNLNRSTSADIMPMLVMLLFIVAVLLLAHAVHLRQVLKKHIQHLRKSERRFQALFSGNKCVELVINPETASIIEANRAAEKFYGYSRDELLLMKITDINMSPKEDVQQKLQQAKSGNMEGVFQFKHKLANGSIRRVEVYADTIDWGDEKVIYSVIFDITPRWEATRRAHKFEQAIEQTGQAVMITDKDGVVEYVNPSYVALTGYSYEESLGRIPNILKKQDKEMRDTILAGQCWHGKVRRQKKSGQEYLAMVSVSLILNAKGEAAHTVILQMDLSDYERLEQQLQQAQKMEAIGTLVGGIAHDFNNMLAGMVGNLYLAKKKVGKQEDVVEKLNNVEQLSYKASDMISQLLTFARKGCVTIEPMSLNNFLEDTLRLFQSIIPENIKVSKSLCDKNLYIEGDSTQLYQILMNLVSNAQDALEDATQPEIQIQLDHYTPTDAFLKKKPYFAQIEYARLCVRDNGKGISEGDKTQLFEPFFTTKEQGKGTGLGLSMVFGAVKTHGGFVEVESKKGVGTTFCLYFPLLEEEPSQLPLQKSSVNLLKGDGELILLVDDEDHIIETGREVLEHLGYKVLLARNGVEAIDIYKRYKDKVSLIMIDVVMPKLGGIEAIKRIRKIDSKVKVVFSTGYDNTFTLASEGSMQKEVVLSKPYRIDSLAEVIKSQI